jgi:hypothetical protein
MRWRHDRSPEERDPGNWLVVGAPLPGSEAEVDGMAPAGVDAIRTADPAFDPEAFTAWAGSVYRRAVGAWRSKTPELLRPVMDQEVWDRYAQYMLTAGTVALAQKLMASAQAAPTLAGAAADARCHSVKMSFAVAITGPDASVVDASARRWTERWLFQRPASSRTHPSGAVAVCPVCGGPADPGDSGQCRYCHSDISTRTAGWLVTQTATTMVGAARMAQHLTEREAAAPPAGSAPAQPPRAGTPVQPPRAAPQ